MPDKIIKKPKKHLRNYSIDVLFPECAFDEKILPFIKAAKEALTKKIIEKYRPERTFESACDHGVPFDELKEHQFMDSVRLAYIHLFDKGRKEEARDVAVHYGLFEYYGDKAA